MSNTLRITLFIALIIYFIMLFWLLKRQILSLKYTLLWLLTGMVLSLFVFVPELLTFIVHFLGIELPINGLFTIGIGFILIILMSLTAIVSGQKKEIRILIQRMALLEKRIRELEKQ